MLFDFCPYRRIAAAVLEHAIVAVRRGYKSGRPMERQDTEVQEALQFLCVRGIEGARHPWLFHEVCDVEELAEMDPEVMAARILGSKQAKFLSHNLSARFYRSKQSPLKR